MRRPSRASPLTLAGALSFTLTAAPPVQPQTLEPDRPGEPAPTVPAKPDYENPWARRPACASMFLKSDWALSKKQRTCDWLQNRLFSTTALAGAAWSAGVSKVRDAPSERGDGYSTRFARRLGQSAIKSTGAFVGAAIAGEDPRVAPPYLVMKNALQRPGLWRRATRALAYNFVSYRCGGECRTPDDVRHRPALSRILGSLASGYAAELLTHDRATSHRRALRGAATAYGSTFVDALFTEFKPELTGAAGRLFGGVLGFR